MWISEVQYITCGREGRMISDILKDGDSLLIFLPPGRPEPVDVRMLMYLIGLGVISLNA
jgi:hypothetical protein